MHGGEGSLQLDVYSAQMMPVPDPRKADKVLAKRLQDVLSLMRKRHALPLVDVDGTGDEWSGELAIKDRQELDDAVLELLGITNRREREALRSELYAEMTRMYREIRATERKMQKFRTATARRGRPSPQALADEIWKTFNEEPTAKALAQFVPPQAKTESVQLPQGKAKAVFADMFNPNSLVMGKQFVALGSPERVEYALQLSEDGVSGQVSIPVDPATCRKALREYQEHVETLSDIFTNAAAGYTADEQMQSRIVNELWRRAGGK
jgi:hypothetical protein